MNRVLISLLSLVLTACLVDVFMLGRVFDQRTQEALLLDSEAVKEPTKRTLHVLNGLYGNDTGFIDEWEVNFKSVLSNAPLDANLHIHVLTNADAFLAVQDRVEASGMIGSQWRNQVTLTCYNVEGYLKDWRVFLNEKLRGQKLDERVSLGGYFRLLAHNVVLNHTYRDMDGAVVYMDTDVVVMANLNDIIQYIDATKLYQFSETWPNSGFMVVNLKKFHTFWELLDKLPEIRHGGDQSLVIMLHEAFPNVTGTLPPAWDTHLGHGWRKAPQTILDSERDVAILHFTGAMGNSYFEGSLDKYCHRGPGCDEKEGLERFRMSWGLAEYYVKLQWSWVKYFAKTTIPPGEQGYPFRYELID